MTFCLGLGPVETQEVVPAVEQAENQSTESENGEPKDGENTVRNWLEEQDNPRFKPTLNLWKLKADRERGEKTK